MVIEVERNIDVQANNVLVPNFASFYGESVLPPSHEAEKMSAYDFQTSFPVRFELWDTIKFPGEGVSQFEPGRIEHLKRDLHILNSLDRYVDRNKADVSRRILYDRQFSVFEDVDNHLELGFKEGYIKAPPGFGKTILFGQVVAACDVPTIIVEPTKVLVEQTYKLLKQYSPDLDVGRYYSKEKEKNKIIVTTYDSLIGHVGEDFDPENTHLLILDEAHKALSGKRIEAVQKFKQSIKLGFTATPDYTQDKRLVNLLNYPIHEVSIEEAVGAGYISPFSVFLAETDIDASSISITPSGDFNNEEMGQLILEQGGNKAAVEMYKQINDIEKKRVAETNTESKTEDILAVTFCASIRQAQDAVEEYAKSGISAAAVWGKQNEDEQREILEKFERGEIQVLCNANLLIEGFDNPRVKLVLNTSPTTSRVKEEQRSGRAFRIDPGDPQKHAYIVDFIYKNINKKNMQVTLAEIIDGAGYRKLPTDQGEKTDGMTFPEFHIEGLNVITDAAEILRFIRDQEEQRYNLAPEGWMNMSQLVATFPELTYETISTVSKRMKGEFPDNVGQFLSPAKRPAEYFSPAMVELIAERLLTYQKVPEGWKAVSGVARKAGLISSKRTARVINMYRADHPEWFMTRTLLSDDKAREYISPELASIVVEKMKEWQEMVGEWTTYPGASNVLGRSPQVIRRLAKDYRVDHPEWFRGIPQGDKELDYIHKDLVNALEEQLASVPHAPGDWLTRVSSAEGAEIDPRTYDVYAKKYVEENEEASTWRGWFLNSKNKKTLFYHPELVKALNDYFSSIVPVPEGWRTLNNIVEDKTEGDFVIRTLADTYRTDRSEWFQEYRAPGGQIHEYYHPDLVGEIETKLAERMEADPNYINLNQAGISTGLDSSYILRRANVKDQEFKRDHPEEESDIFRDYKASNGRITQFIRKDIVDSIAAEKQNQQVIPEGWVKLEDISSETGIGIATVRKNAQNYERDHEGSLRSLINPDNGRAITYGSPDLATKLREKLNLVTPAPEGWRSAKQVVTGLGRTTPWFKTRKEFLREKGWLSTHLNSSNQSVDHISPEGIAWLKLINSTKTHA